MYKAVNVEDMYAWLKIMANTEVISERAAFWRLTGATSILVYLDLLTPAEKDQIDQEFIDKHIAETGA